MSRPFRRPTAIRPGFPAFNAYITAQFIAEAYKKAGKIDKEKFIDALEGLKVKSPVGGMVEMRKCDHQAVYPMHFGVTKKAPRMTLSSPADIIDPEGRGSDAHLRRDHEGKEEVVPVAGGERETSPLRLQFLSREGETTCCLMQT